MKKIYFLYSIAALLLLTQIVSCSTSPNSFEAIHVGNDKGRVLHVLGSPKRTYRKNSVDHWVYDLPQNNSKTPSLEEKEIWFQNGKVIYKDDGEHSNAKLKKDGPQDSDFIPVD